MPLEAGRTLLHYCLVDKIGEGGMGVVWKAVDSTLDREVAIKILPGSAAESPERSRRFAREAKLLASLNHTNIGAIHGFEQAGEIHFIVLELISGTTLTRRISQRPMPLDDAMRTCRDIARALEAAHEKGIIHRDLKPENIKVTEDDIVKVLDFGLATVNRPPTLDESLAPTLTSGGTQAGAVMGTVPYMSPEQTRGQAVDKRTDIWSFGCVLYECLTGCRPFPGEAASDTLAAIIGKEPDWAKLPKSCPPSLRRLVGRCLRKDPRERLRDIGDARISLEDALQAPESEVTSAVTELRPVARPLWTTVGPWVLVAVSIAVATWFGLSSRSGPTRSPVMRFEISMSEGLTIDTGQMRALAVSPDGTQIAFVGRGEAGDGLYLRAIGQDSAVLLAGTAGVHTPVFSPDGQWIAFVQDQKLKKISVSGGPPATLCDTPQLRGVSWSSAGELVFAPDRGSGLMLVPESGGTPSPLTELEAAENESVLSSHRWPEFLPDGKTVLFTSTPNDSRYDIADIVAISLVDGSRKVVVKGGTFPKFVSTGFLVFLRQSTLFAARFSPETVELTGPPVPILEGVRTDVNAGCGQLSFSDNGLLVYLSRSSLPASARLVWIDRDGRSSPASAHEGIYNSVRISPDGRRAVLQVTDPPKTNLWMLEFSRDSLSRFTFDELTARNAVWSPDGKWIVFAAFRGGATSNLFRKRSNGTGEAQRLTTSTNHHNAYSWSPDGKIIAFVETINESDNDILLLRLDSEQPQPEVYLRTPFNENWPSFSPDGKWIAYSSDESGNFEIYVRPLAGSARRVKVSTNGGRWVVWSADGNELIYVDDDGDKLMAVRFSVTDNEFRPELAQELLDYPSKYGNQFNIARDSGRFLVDENVLPEGAAIRQATVIVNWFDELERKAPAR